MSESEEWETSIDVEMTNGIACLSGYVSGDDLNVSADVVEFNPPEEFELPDGPHVRLVFDGEDAHSEEWVSVSVHMSEEEFGDLVASIQDKPDTN